MSKLKSKDLKFESFPSLNEDIEKTSIGIEGINQENRH